MRVSWTLFPWRRTLDVHVKTPDSVSNILGWGLVLMAAIATGIISTAGLHHWHEVRFMYLTSEFSMLEILTGVFNPHQVGFVIDEQSTAGFHYAKILHLSLLKLLFHWIHPSEGGLTIAVGGSLVLAGVSAFFAYRIFRLVVEDHDDAVLGLFCFLLAPVTPYLAGKLLSEVIALPMVTISCWMLLSGSASPKRDGWRFVFGCAAFLLLASLARLDMVMSLVSCAAALVISAETSKSRAKDLLFFSKVFVIWLLTYVLVALMLGFPLANLAAYFISFVNSDAKSNVMSLLGVVTFGGAVYLLAILSVVQRRNERSYFLMLWFIFSLVPHALLTQRYMIEPRYLVSAIVPLSALGGLGLATFLRACNGGKFRYVLAVGVLLLMISLNTVIVRLMPYELDRPALLAAVDRILQSDRRASILLPWAYSDFHFLRVMRPQAQMFNVNTPTTENGANLLDDVWRLRLKQFYGDHYLTAPQDLDRVLESGRAYYLSWGQYPPLENAKEIAKRLGMTSAATLLNEIKMMDHSAQSWIWYSKRYQLESKGQFGQYRFYRVRYRR
jgi:hypothetical protein